MTSRTVTCETSSPPSTTNHQDIPRPTQEAKSVGRGGCIPDLARTGGAGGACNPHVVGPHTKNRQRVRRDGRSGRSHHPVPERPPRCARSENGGMVGRPDVGRHRRDKHGGWRLASGVFLPICRAPRAKAQRPSTPPLSQEPRAPATVAARGRTQAYAMRSPLLSCESLTCLLHDTARAAAVVGAWNDRPAGWMHTSTPPSRGNRGEGTT